MAIMNGDNGNNTLRGGIGDDTLDGWAGDDLLLLQDGGNDIARGGIGNDIFYFGSTMDVADSVDGGPRNDQLDMQGLPQETDRLYLQGNYVGARALTLSGVATVEQLILLSADDTRFGGNGPGPFSYNITTADRNVVRNGFDPFGVFTIDARSLRPDETLVVDGWAESDSTLFIRAGQGTASITGSNDWSRGDFLEFGDNFTADDKVNGLDGQDYLVLRGNYSGSRALLLERSFAFQGMEGLYMISGHTMSYNYYADKVVSFDSDVGDVHYVVTTADSLIPTGGFFATTASTLLASETVVFDGSAETDGRFFITGGGGADRLTAGAMDDFVDGRGGNDLLLLDKGGIDRAYGGAGDDVFYFGAAMTRADLVEGGPGSDTLHLQGLPQEIDRLYLQGSYVGARALTLSEVQKVEQLILLSAGDTRFGGQGPGPFSYSITTVDRNVVINGFDPFAVFTIDARSLRPDETLVVDGRNEYDGSLLIRAGQGTASLTGGNSDRGDYFEFGDNFTADDKVNGGLGIDMLVLRGNYSGSRALALQASPAFQGMEGLLLISGHATTYNYFAYNAMSFDPDVGDLHYAVTAADNLVPAGAFFIIGANSLLAGETLVFDGSAESDGRFFITGGGGADRITAGAMDDFVDGGGGNDLLLLAEGGNDSAFGGSGNDIFYFGATMDEGDSTDGGPGRDAVVLQGNIVAVLTDSSLVDIESISLQSGANAAFGDTANNFYDFDLTIADSNVAEGRPLIVNAQSLRAGEDFAFDGSAESDGRFLIYGGHGMDSLTGGAGDDIFFFEGDRWSSGDSVDGGAGIDQLTLRGPTTVDFGSAQLAGIETLALMSRSPAGSNSYHLTMTDANVAAGRQLTVDASALRADETLAFNGTNETDGSFLLLGGRGNDTLLAGQNGDVLVGGLGRDMLLGNGGNDVFRYDSVADSTPSAQDTVRDFTLGDLIDLSRIDADTLTVGDQAFSFIGSAAFGNRAGELRIQDQRAPFWLVQGDTDGDGIADFELVVVAIGQHSITSGDFVL